MADPVTLAAVGMGTAAAGGAVGAFGSMFKGSAESNMYKYQAGVARVNAVVAKQDADYARAAGEVESQTSGMRTRAEVGATRAGMAAGNVDINTGSGKKVVASEIAIGQQNEAIIHANAAKRAYGFDVKSAADTAQAGAYDVAATTSKEAGEIGAISSVIGAAGNVASKWMQFRQSFGLPGATGGAPGPDLGEL
jgi:hypothetical protein